MDTRNERPNVENKERIAGLVYNVLDEGGSSDLDAYLESGSEAGLQRIENLFPELT